MKAKVRWFDGLSGEGMVRTEDDKSYYLHFTAIDGINKHNYQFPSLSDQETLKNINGRDCEIELIIDTTFIQVSKCTLI